MADHQNHLKSQNQVNEPPDIGSMQIDDTNMQSTPATFLQTLISNKYLSPTLNTQLTSFNTPDLSDVIIHNPANNDTFIPITSTDKSRLYEPWQYSVIVKLFGRRIIHQILRSKLIAL